MTTEFSRYRYPSPAVITLIDTVTCVRYAFLPASPSYEPWPRPWRDEPCVQSQKGRGSVSRDGRAGDPCRAMGAMRELDVREYRAWRFRSFG